MGNGYFIYDGRRFDAPDPNMTVDQVRLPYVK